MSLYNCVDAAFPGHPLPDNTQLVNMYVGDPGPDAPDTLHIWTAAEADEYEAAHPAIRFIPSYVHNYDNADPVGDANNACDAIERLGWAPFQKGLTRRVLSIDCETLIDPAYFTDMQRQVAKRGFSPILYGSTWFVVQNPSPLGYWFAAPSGRRPTTLAGNARGVQWRWGASWNLSVMDDIVYLAAGRGARH